ncbi:MAG: GNAT family N-acetyltransferase [Acidobacteriota bacterium]
MEIIDYSGEHQKDCVRVLESNLGQYFVEREIRDFVEFLEGEATVEPYFVVINDAAEVAACGGITATADKAVLTWGLVEHRLHGKGIGQLLLRHRLRSIRERYGALPVEIETSQKTQGFFEKYGFRPVRRDEDGISKGLDRVLMVRPAESG